MARKFSELRSKMSPAARAHSEARARAMLAEMPLQELRVARGLSQQALAASLKVRQASISKLERRGFQRRRDPERVVLRVTEAREPE